MPLYATFAIAKKLNQYYVGATNDLEERLRRHNSDADKFTSKGAPWKVVHQEAFATKADAMKRERPMK